MSRSLRIEAVRPTQLYLSAEKLAAVLEWFDPDEPGYEPLPTFQYEGESYLADGHTRAFVAWLCGADELRVERDPTIRSEYDFDLYRTCISWCREADLHTVADFTGRVLGPEAYESRWIERCHRAAEDPAAE